MDIQIRQGDLTQISCDVLIVNLFEGVAIPGGATGAVNLALDGWLADQITEQQFKGKLNSILDVPTFGNIPAKRVLVVGLGKRETFGTEQIRQSTASAIKRAKELKARTVATLLHGAGIAGLPTVECAQAVTEGVLLGGYAFDKYKSAPADEPKTEIESVIIVEIDATKLSDVEAGVYKGQIIADAANLTRDLANEPPDLITPGELARIARDIADTHGLRCEIWDEQRLAEERMRCLLMVGRASSHPPRFIRLDYVPEGTPRKRVCLIGKGICYDSGGLSLKPAEFMKHMKTDMAGAAAVLCAVRAIARLKPDVAVTVLVPTCENMVSGLSYKVDDILRARNGKTIEIDNTDAEGRLILADALSLAAEESFDAVIDVATLTGGACLDRGDG